MGLKPVKFPSNPLILPKRSAKAGARSEKRSDDWRIWRLSRSHWWRRRVRGPKVAGATSVFFWDENTHDGSMVTCTYHLVMTNIAMENPENKWRFSWENHL